MCVCECARVCMRVRVLMYFVMLYVCYAYVCECGSPRACVYESVNKYIQICAAFTHAHERSNACAHSHERNQSFDCGASVAAIRTVRSVRPCPTQCLSETFRDGLLSHALYTASPRPRDVSEWTRLPRRRPAFRHCPPASVRVCLPAKRTNYKTSRRRAHTMHIVLRDVRRPRWLRRRGEVTRDTGPATNCVLNTVAATTDVFCQGPNLSWTTYGPNVARTKPGRFSRARTPAQSDYCNSSSNTRLPVNKCDRLIPLNGTYFT